MSKNTKIEWCHHTFNPWWGCSKVSEACRNCYAETLAKRTGKDFGNRVKTKGPWKDLLKWDAAAGKRGVRERVFVGSMCDIGDGHPDVWAWRQAALFLLASLKNLDVLLLTKRPKILLNVLGFQFGDVLPEHFWVGCTVENQRQAALRVPNLLRIPAAVRFLSVEPMLGDLRLFGGYGLCGDTDAAIIHQRETGIDWVIAGGESGPRARPTHPRGFRNLRDQCKAAGVPFLFKQWGEYAPYRWQSTVTMAADVVCLDNGTMFTIDQNGQMPAYAGGFDILRRVGKGNAGRELDGVVWDEYPESSSASDADELGEPKEKHADFFDTLAGLPTRTPDHRS